MASSPTARPPAALFACPSLSHLERLPPSVFAIVAQHVCFQDRFTTLSRLSQHVPPLTPACFHHEHLTWVSNDIFTLLTHPTLFLLLSHCAGLRFISHTVDPETLFEFNVVDLLSTLTSDEHTAAVRFSDVRRAAPLFPRLEQLSIDVGYHSRLLHTLFPSPAVFPVVTTLHLRVLTCDEWNVRWPAPVPPSFLAPLRQCLPLLRVLTLVGVELSPAALQLLCTLPLTCLDTARCQVVAQPAADSACAVSDEAGSNSEAAVTDTWESVLLPFATFGLGEQTVSQAVLAMLCAYSARFKRRRAGIHVSPVQPLVDDGKTSSVPPLRYLAYNGLYMPSVLECAARMACLVTLDLDAASADVPFIDFSPLFHPTSLVPRLPHLLHFRAPRTMAVPDRNWPSEVTRPFVEQYLDLLTAYRSQLQLLSVMTIQHADLMRVFDHTLTCLQVRSLTLWPNGLLDEPLLPYPLSSPLPAPSYLLHLHTLHLHNLPLTSETVAQLFVLCPALEDCYLDRLPYLSLDLLPLLSTISPKLRRLRVELDQPHLFMHGSTLRHPSSPVFPCLAVLSVECYPDYCAPHFELAAVASLVDLLHFAPQLQYLYLSVNLPAEHVHLFSSLQQLVALRVSDANLPVGAEGELPVGTQQSQYVSDHRSWLDGGVVSESGMRTGWQLFQHHPLRFVAERVYDGMNGREAFFRALPQPAAQTADALLSAHSSDH